MLNISIDKENTIVENTGLLCKWTLKTVDVFGNVYATLEKNFPDFKTEELGNIIVTRISKKLAGKPVDDPVKIFGCSEIGESFYELIMFIDGKTVLSPTLKDIEEMRISHRMTANYLPISLGEKDSMRFEGLKTVTQVMIAALYYYAYNEYKIVRCRHCGKWFATKTLKEQYCKRISPCFGDIIKGKTPLPCEQAVRNIKQKQSRRHKNVYSYLDISAKDQDEIEYFKTESKKLKEAITRSPSVENFKRYEDFLNKYPKRMVRR